MANHLSMTGRSQRTYEMSNVALVSCYEGGLQPLGLATAAAHLISANHLVRCWDASVTAPSADDLCSHDMVAFSVPLFESLDPAIELLADLRTISPELPVFFYGNHAMLHKELLFARGADGIVLGDWELVLVDIASVIMRGVDFTTTNVNGLATRQKGSSPVNLRKGYVVPNRECLPPLSSYSYPEATKRVGNKVVVGNVETARGCRFSCSYCSVFAATHQRVTIFPEEGVLEDISQVLRMGASHICFVDAEFLNAPAHALSIASKMHQRFPKLTFDFTSRADLIAEDPARIEQLQSCGAKFVTTAFEFPKQEVLDAINKQFSVPVLKRALDVCRAVGLGINPTFLLFNPWISFEDLEMFSQFLIENRLENDVDPVQMQTRLWLYSGSPLLGRPEFQSVRSVRSCNLEWEHPDPDVERVFRILSENNANHGSTKRCCLKC